MYAIKGIFQDQSKRSEGILRHDLRLKREVERTQFALSCLYRLRFLSFHSLSCCR